MAPSLQIPAEQVNFRFDLQTDGPRAACSYSTSYPTFVIGWLLYKRIMHCEHPHGWPLLSEDRPYGWPPLSGDSPPPLARRRMYKELAAGRVCNITDFERNWIRDAISMVWTPQWPCPTCVWRQGDRLPPFCPATVCCRRLSTSRCPAERTKRRIAERE